MKWTEKEEEYMRRRYLLQSVQVTSQKLNRTVYSVKRKAAQMGLSHYNDALNAKSIAKCFNSDVSVVIRWITKFNLPCKIIKCNNQKRYVISQKDFWCWANAHRDIIKWNKYINMSILPQPSWVIDEVANYSEKRKREKYSDEEIIQIKNYLHRGLSYQEIAELMGRTYYGINHLCSNIYNRKD